MFVAQRLQRIREILLEREIVDVPSLSEELHVSEVTIRRDFDKLEKEGFINKTYGGAILNKDHIITKIEKQPPDDTNDETTKLINKIAQQMIQDNEVIYLGGGPICRLIAGNISNKNNLSVITNDIHVAAKLCINPSIKITVTGGDVINSSGIMIGPRVSSILKEIYLSKAFIEVKGVDLKFGYSMENYDEVVITRKIIEISKEVVALVDYNNFDNISYVKLGDLNMFNKVITSKDISEDFKKYYFNNFIKLYTTYEVK